MSAYDDYLNALADAGGSNLENFDATENLLSPAQHFEALEVEQYLVKAKQMAPNKARMIAARIVQNPKALATTKVDMQRYGIGSAFNMNPATPPQMADMGAKLEAQVNFQIQRLTANIAADLPVPLFGSYDLENNYKQVVSANMPTGTSITNITGGRTAGQELELNIEYTNGLNVDIIKITMQEYAYLSFLKALQGSRFLINTARYSVSDSTATGLQQLTKKLYSQQISMFGKDSKDNIPLGASKSPFQQQNAIVDIIGSFVINAEISWVLMFQPLALQEVTISAFISKADKIGLGV